MKSETQRFCAFDFFCMKKSYVFFFFNFSILESVGCCSCTTNATDVLCYCISTCIPAPFHNGATTSIQQPVSNRILSTTSISTPNISQCCCSKQLYSANDSRSTGKNPPFWFHFFFFCSRKMNVSISLQLFLLQIVYKTIWNHSIRWLMSKMAMTMLP